MASISPHPPASPIRPRRALVSISSPSSSKVSLASEKKVDKKSRKKLPFDDRPAEDVADSKTIEAKIGVPIKTAVPEVTDAKPKTGMIFGRPATERTKCIPEVQSMYRTVAKCTGTIGGNGSGGAIYGELTMASMQKVTNLLVSKGELTKDSVFIDVGAGLGKPNLHVALDPAVKYSVGIEMEHVRWHLSIHNLAHVLAYGGPKNTIFMHGDAYQAKSFDPFTHVYMFDIGKPNVSISDDAAITRLLFRFPSRSFPSFGAVPSELEDCEVRALLS